jgi:hypothetical protein
MRDSTDKTQGCSASSQALSRKSSMTDIRVVVMSHKCSMSDMGATAALSAIVAGTSNAGLARLRRWTCAGHSSENMHVVRVRHALYLR